MKWLKRVGKSLLIGTIMGVVVTLFTNLFFSDLIDKLEYQTYYMRYKWEADAITADKSRESDGYDNGISIINIDERSLHKLGKYQNWDRSYHAQMLRALAQNYPAAVAFDMMFFDPDDSNYVSRLKRLVDTCKSRDPRFALSDALYRPLISAIDYDEQFIAASHDVGNVFHAVIMADKSDYDMSIGKEEVERRMTMAWHDSLHPSSALILPQDKRRQLKDEKPVLDGIFPALARSARDIGFVDMFRNEDGVVREIPLLYGFGANAPVYLPISIRTTATLFATPNNEIVFEPGRYIDIGKPFKIFKDTAGSIRFSYPHVTIPLVKSIISKQVAIRACAPDKRVDVTSQIVISKDAAGAASFDMDGTGTFPPQVVTALLAADKTKILSLAKDASVEIATTILIKRSGAGEWTLSAPVGDGEWTLTKVDLETIGQMTQADLDAVKPGETSLACYGFNVWNKDGHLRTSLPVVNESVLNELWQTNWSTIESMSRGMRMDFGKTLRIPLTKDSKHIVTYFGPKAKTFKYYSYYDIMKNRVHGGLEGKIFLVGATVAGLFDIVPTPVDNQYPGIEIHASLLNSFMNNTFMTRLSRWQDFFILLLVAVIIGVMSYFMKPLFGSILSILAVFAYFLIAMSVFGTSHIWIEIARPILAIVLTFTAVMAYRYITEEKDRKFLQNTFKQYLSPELIDMMYTSKQQPKLGGDEGIRTAYFTDIQGFSTFSEKLGSPTRLVELLNEYLTEMTNTLLARYGTLDKYEGDAIIAFFGAPMPMEDHPKQACLTALDMQNKLADLRKKWISEGDKWPKIVHEMRMRIGINTGPIVTGNMGSATRMNYTMMGDSVNLAARLESAAKQYGVFIMISHFTYDLVKNDFEARQLDKITVVGKSEPVTVFELLSEKGKLSPELQKLVDLYSQGMAQFYAKEWDTAIATLTQAEEYEPHKTYTKTTPSRNIIKLCNEYKVNPPPQNWDGVNRLESK